MWQKASVNAPATCMSESQTSICDDGKWEPWTGTYAELSCSSKAWHVGQRVQVKNQGWMPWFNGTVVQTNPTKVMLDGGAKSYEYDHVRVLQALKKPKEDGKEEAEQ